jgi:hypothetical protein
MPQLLSAYEQATSPRAKNPGALFIADFRGRENNQSSDDCRD